MKKSTAIATALMMSSGFAGTAAAADPSVTANLGMMSDYFYRGVSQAPSVANGGVDLEVGGFYLGTWAADVDDGLEVDVYLGYGFEFEGGFTAGVGFTGYYYTGDFDDTYQEINLSAGWNFLTVDYAVGEYENFSGPTLDYDFLSVTAEYNGFYGLYGTFGDDADGDYFEVGYGAEVSGFDISGAIIFTSDDLANGGPFVEAAGEDDESFVLSISKSFDIL